MGPPNKKRRGVVLLITLSVISAMLVLIGVLFGYLAQARSQAEFKASLVQADLIRKDVGDFLKKYLKDKPSSTALKQLYDTTLAIRSDKGDFSVSVRCRPLLDRIPIVWLGRGKSSIHKRQFELAQSLFERLVDNVDLKEPEKLYNLILQHLKGVHQEFGGAGSLRQKPGSLSEEVFRNLLDDYRFLADDPRVYRINWQQYFQIRSFSVPPEGIDKDFLAPALVSFLYDLDPALIKEEYTPGDLDKFLADVGESSKRYRWLFETRPSIALHCDLPYGFKEGQYNVSFDYLDKRIENFEFQKQ